MPQLPNSVKAGLATAFFTALTGGITSLIGWLDDATAWAAEGDTSMRGALLSLGAAAAIAALNTVVRWVQDRYGIGPSTPVYTPPGDGK